jgi:hypothetical protein
LNLVELTVRGSPLTKPTGSSTPWRRPPRRETGTQPGGASGDRRIGVVWQTPGSGESLTMAFHAGRIIRQDGGLGDR